MTVTDKTESEALLANDLRVLVSELNQRLEQASQRGIDVELSIARLWVVANPAMKAELRIKITSEVR
jgi:hypothetical protein